MNDEGIFNSSSCDISFAESMALVRHAAKVASGQILEIGNSGEKGALALSSGLQVGMRSRQSRYFRIDSAVGLTRGKGEPAATFTMPLHDAAAAWSASIGLLYIHFDHLYPLKCDLLTPWLSQVLDSGTIAIHDHHTLGQSIGKFLEELENVGFNLIERVENIVFVRKRRALLEDMLPLACKSILVVAERNILAGGLMRFQRMHRALKPFGTAITMAFDDLSGPWMPAGIEIVGIREALDRIWDATILPGAGFTDRFIAELLRFHAPNFGTRVQAVLNDRSRADRFLLANLHFAPHSVIFNSADWVSGSYAGFQGERFDVIEGAVDAAHFAPDVNRQTKMSGQAFVVGLQSKYVAALESVWPYLNTSIVFRVMRDEPTKALSPFLADMYRQGRLQFVGAVSEDALPAFYHGCDCILHLELFAGWANLVAEAMACGVPVVCSRAGTAALTDGGKTALIVDPTDPAAVAAALLSVQADPVAAMVRAKAARSHIMRHDWVSYGCRFLAAAVNDGRNHYFCAPEFGLRGKWTLEFRLEGASPLLALAPGARILDIGCAEGLIARHILSAGAQMVHGFDLDRGRIDAAGVICADMPATFRAESITPWAGFLQRQGGFLLPQYDIVLYLGVHQHLDPKLRGDVIEGLIERTGSAIAIRMPDNLFDDEHIAERLIAAGFRLLPTHGSALGGEGYLRIFIRTEVQ